MPTSTRISKIESLATLDGEGVRCAVFFCGCPLRCVYCHNPETWNCRGVEYTPQELCQKLARFKPYYADNGGVTFSGGEPLLQAAFINECEPILKKHGIGYWLDTSGAVDLSNEVKQSLAAADGVILDLKFFTSEDYLKYTGVDMSNVLATGDYLQEIGAKVWLRTVIVPGINDSQASIDQYAAIAKRWKNIRKYELLAFHTMGFSKYEDLKIENPLKEYRALSQEELIKLQNYLDALCCL